MKKIFLYVLGAILAMVLTIITLGSFLPEKHTATVSKEINAPISKVWKTISNFSDFGRWRTDLQRVKVLNDLSWRETNAWDDSVTFKIVEISKAKKMVVKIMDKDLPFGGQWSYQLDSLDINKTRLSITENGEIYNWAFRFMARYIFGYTMTMDAFIGHLEKELKQQLP